MRRAWFGIVVSLAVLASGCGSGSNEEPGAGSRSEAGASGETSEEYGSFQQPFKDVEAYPVIVSSEIVVGENRFQLGILNDNDAPIGSPAVDVHADFFDLERSPTQPVEEADMRFTPTARGRGVYVGTVTFDAAGKWGVEVTIEGEGITETVRTSFDVAKEPATPAAGHKVPASDSPTLDDAGSIAEISTDPTPVRRFYRASIHDTVKSGEPFVVVFATPEFCQTAVCGPTLDVVNRVARDFPRLIFIHVEIYEDLDPAKPVVEAVSEWGLPTEPWVFVVDSRARVAAKYEGSVSVRELRHELRALAR